MCIFVSATGFDPLGPSSDSLDKKKLKMKVKANTHTHFRSRTLLRFFFSFLLKISSSKLKRATDTETSKAVLFNLLFVTYHSYIQNIEAYHQVPKIFTTHCVQFASLTYTAFFF